MKNQIFISKFLTIQEIEILLVAPNHSPILLQPDFLFGSGIVPTDWEFTRTPQIDPQFSLVAFNNGIDFIAQPGQITFSESLKIKSTEKLKIPAIARKYVEILPHLDYQAVGINPRSFITFDCEDEDAARNYIVNTLLSPAPWLEVGDKPVRADVKLAYTLEKRQLTLRINETILHLPEKPSQPAILFSGNFPYEIVGDTPSQRLQHLFQLIDNWQKDLESYREIVRRFLGKEVF